MVTIDPVRILDTRDPVNIGLPGPFRSAVSQKLQVTGSAVPAGATGVLLNVTVVGPSAVALVAAVVVQVAYATHRNPWVSQS